MTFSSAKSEFGARDFGQTSGSCADDAQTPDSGAASEFRMSVVVALTQSLHSRSQSKYINSSYSKESGKLKLILLVVLLGVCGFGYWKWRQFASNPDFAQFALFFERDNPKVELVEPPAGLGTEGNEFQIKLQDMGTGLDEVIVRVEQGGDTHEVLRKSYNRGQFEDLVNLKLNGKQLKLTEGAFRLNVVAFDRSFWSNGGRLDSDFPIDYLKPKLEIVSVQHNAVIGGSELLFYRVRDDDLALSGVVVAGEKFIGHPAKELDPEFTKVEDLYYTFFVLPPLFDSERDTLQAFARDKVGNRSFSGFYYKAQSVRGAIKERDISHVFAKSQLAHVSGDAIEGRTESDPLRGYARSIEKEIFPESEAKVRSITANVITPKLWSNPFLRAPFTVRNDFGDLKRFVLEGQELFTRLSVGTDTLVKVGTPVPAVNAGKVLFSGDFGVYGQTIIVDHGAGLTTLYGYLSRRIVKEGEVIEKGEFVGESGSSGLAEGEQAHFEFRIQGVPCRTIEWWDKRWVSDHIDHKIDGVKESLGIVSETVALDPATSRESKGSKSGEKNSRETSTEDELSE